jgi:hypothetical protein
MNSISVNSEPVKELYLIIKKHENLTASTHCKTYSALASTLFLSERDKTFIIDGASHSVFYDGKDTWDFKAGFVLRNYMFPAKKIPKYEDIPLFVDGRKNISFDTYFEDYYISSIGKPFNVNVVKGFYYGTEKN